MLVLVQRYGIAISTDNSRPAGACGVHRDEGPTGEGSDLQDQSARSRRARKEEYQRPMSPWLVGLGCARH